VKFTPTAIAGVMVAHMEPFGDERGVFERRFCAREVSAALGYEVCVKQVNRSTTCVCGTLRGMHLQTPPMCETKIVQCMKGRIFDVAVDVRKGSSTYLRWHGEELSPESGSALCIPHGVAHGYQSLSDEAEVLYFTDQFYAPVNERTLNHADPTLSIAWPLPVSLVSEKDRRAPLVDGSFVPVVVDTSGRCACA